MHHPPRRPRKRAHFLPRPPRQPLSRDLLPSLRRALESSRADGDHGRQGGRPVVVLGVGSELRSDDAAGVKVAERLAALIAHPGLPGVFAVNGGPAPENTTAEIRQLSPSLVIIVDAADMGGPAGTVRVLDPGAVSAASFGTHGLALGVLADYLRAEMKCRVILIGIQPASVEHGEMLSEEVSTAVNELVDALRECLA